MKRIYLLFVFCCLSIPGFATCSPLAISGPASVCIGDNLITLSDGTGGGVWTCTAGTGTASIGSASGTVTGLTAGTVTISYTTSGCIPATYVVTVYPGLDAITGSTSVCSGDTTNLTDASGAGTWSTSAPSIAIVGSGSGTVTGQASGNANIIYTNTATGCFTSQLETVNVNPGAISGPTSVCLGATVALTDASGGTWSSFASGIASVGSTDGMVTGHMLGSTTISYILSTGCYATQLMTVDPIPGPINGSTLVCARDSIALSDITTGGTWSSEEYWIASVGSSTGEVTGIIGGNTATISYTLSTGCFRTFTDTVVTAPSHILGDTTICVGYSSVLSDSVAGGWWHSAAYGSLTIGTFTGDILAVAPGSVGITYSVSGCPSVTRNVTVNATPSTIVGVASLCDSIHQNLYDLTAGGVWSSNDTITARIVGYPDSGVAIGVSLGVTTISYTLATGCFATLSVTVNPLAPPISGTDTICSTGTAWLTDIVDTGHWTSSNPAIASINVDSGYLVGLVPGVTYIIYTLPTGCSASLLETVIPPVSPILGASQVCSGSIIDMVDADSGGIWSSANNYIASVVDTSGVLSGHYHGTVTISYTVSALKGCYATSSILVNPLPTPEVYYSFGTYPAAVTYDYYTSYQWYNDRTGLIPGGIQDSLFLPNYNDSVYVTVTDTNGCTSSSSWFYNHSTGVQNVSNTSIKIFPNPVTSTIYIDGAVPARAVISGVDGKKIIEQADAKEMNISALAPGMYILTLYNDEEQIILTQKVIKE